MHRRITAGLASLALAAAGLAGATPAAADTTDSRRTVQQYRTFNDHNSQRRLLLATDYGDGIYRERVNVAPGRSGWGNRARVPSGCTGYANRGIRVQHLRGGVWYAILRGGANVLIRCPR